MKCYNCKKLFRNKDAKYCPFCGELQGTYVTKKKYKIYTEKDNKQLTRIEHKLDMILINILKCEIGKSKDIIDLKKSLKNIIFKNNRLLKMLSREFE